MFEWLLNLFSKKNNKPVFEINADVLRLNELFKHSDYQYKPPIKTYGNGGINGKKEEDMSEKEKLLNHWKYSDYYKKQRHGTKFQKHKTPKGFYIYQNHELANKHQEFFEKMTPEEYENWIKINRNGDHSMFVKQRFTVDEPFIPR